MRRSRLCRRTWGLRLSGEGQRQRPRAAALGAALVQLQAPRGFACRSGAASAGGPQPLVPACRLTSPSLALPPRLFVFLGAGRSTRRTGSGGAAGACRRFSGPCRWMRWASEQGRGSQEESLGESWGPRVHVFFAALGAGRRPAGGGGRCAPAGASFPAAAAAFTSPSCVCQTPRPRRAQPALCLQLRELIEAEEEGTWPDIVLNCLRQKKKVEGVRWAAAAHACGGHACALCSGGQVAFARCSVLWQRQREWPSMLRLMRAPWGPCLPCCSVWVDHTKSKPIATKVGRWGGRRTATASLPWAAAPPPAAPCPNACAVPAFGVPHRTQPPSPASRSVPPPPTSPPCTPAAHQLHPVWHPGRQG